MTEKMGTQEYKIFNFSLVQRRNTEKKNSEIVKQKRESENE